MTIKWPSGTTLDQGGRGGSGSISRPIIVIALICRQANTTALVISAEYNVWPRWPAQCVSIATTNDVLLSY